MPAFRSDLCVVLRNRHSQGQANYSRIGYFPEPPVFTCHQVHRLLALQILNFFRSHRTADAAPKFSQTSQLAQLKNLHLNSPALPRSQRPFRHRLFAPRCLFYLFYFLIFLLNFFPIRYRTLITKARNIQQCVSHERGPIATRVHGNDC